MYSLMLFCAVIASLGAGVFMAQVVCLGIFRVFRMQVGPVETLRGAKQAVPDLEVARG
jgi:hypothetical protein